jgi:hypothetical protein
VGNGPRFQNKARNIADMIELVGNISVGQIRLKGDNLLGFGAISPKDGAVSDAGCGGQIVNVLA